MSLLWCTTSLVSCWTLNIGLYFLVFCLFRLYMYVLFVTNPALAAESNKPLLNRTLSGLKMSDDIYNFVIQVIYVCPPHSLMSSRNVRQETIETVRSAAEHAGWLTSLHTYRTGSESEPTTHSSTSNVILNGDCRPCKANTAIPNYCMR